MLEHTRSDPYLRSNSRTGRISGPERRNLKSLGADRTGRRPEWPRGLPGSRRSGHALAPSRPGSPRICFESLAGRRPCGQRNEL